MTRQHNVKAADLSPYQTLFIMLSAFFLRPFHIRTQRGLSPRTIPVQRVSKRVYMHTPQKAIQM